MEEARAFDVRVLYVEDEADAREQLTNFLGRRVRELLVAENGREGLALYEEHSPDLVVTDIRMPHMDGLAMARAIRKIRWGAKIIVTTAHSDTAYLFEAIDIGLDGYVLKPVETKKLLEVMGKCVEAIEAKRLARELHEKQEKLLAELREALAKVKLLSGFLPICCSCKKIRDDAGYWRQLEVYIRDHSEAEFTHSICPECARRLYPEVYDKKRGAAPEGS